MLNRKHKFITLFVVMLLIVGLILVGCKSQEPAETGQPTTPSEQPAEQPTETEQPAEPSEQPAETEQPAALSYSAATYTNTEHGFSVQYPKDWAERTELVNEIVVAAFGVPAFIPGMSLSVADADAPLTADWIVAQTNTLPDTSGGQVTSDIEETTLSDGTPAFEYTLIYNYQAYEIKAFGVCTDKDGKRIRAWVWTIDAFSPYDEALFSEIAHTLSIE